MTHNPWNLCFRFLTLSDSNSKYQIDVIYSNSRLNIVLTDVV